MFRRRIGKVGKIAALTVAAAVAGLAVSVLAVRALPGSNPHHGCSAEVCTLPPVALP